jgi:PTS system mannose-specific IID component
MVGTMIPSTVKIKVKTVFTYGEATESIQDIINQIMPYLLPVVLTAVIYWLLGRKNFTTVRMVWIVIAFATLLTFVGIL